MDKTIELLRWDCDICGWAALTTAPTISYCAVCGYEIEQRADDNPRAVDVMLLDDHQAALRQLQDDLTRCVRGLQ